MCLIFNNVQVKVKFIVCLIKHHDMKTYKRMEVLLHILNVITGWRWVFSFTLWPLYTRGTRPPYKLFRRLGGPRIRCAHYGEKKNRLPLPGIQPKLHVRCGVSHNRSEYLSLESNPSLPAYSQRFHRPNCLVTCCVVDVLSRSCYVVLRVEGHYATSQKVAGSILRRGRRIFQLT
jgi:hypothetical protein